MDIINAVDLLTKQIPRPEMALWMQDDGDDATLDEFRKFAKQVLTYSTFKYQNIEDLYQQQIEWLDKIRKIHG